MTIPAARPSVLLVDDNPMMRRSMTLLLDSLGWSSTEASNSEQALEQLKWRDYDLAILDLRMPGINGIELCRLIHLQSLKKVPVVFILSGYINHKDRVEALEAGAREILDKPLSRDELIRILQKNSLPCFPFSVPR